PSRIGTTLWPEDCWGTGPQLTLRRQQLLCRATEPLGGDMNGNKTSDGNISFDSYEQDEAIAMTAKQANEAKAATVGMIDEPSWPITEYIQLLEQIQNLPPAQQQAALDQFYQTHAKPQLRIALSRNPDTSASLDLKDAQGNNRLVLDVDSSGNPHLQFLDASGNVISQLP